ncbi:DUF3152 domain-containing protein [Micromonospora sp. NBC_01699]|uniref:DUF3152 domain-containing protein n=1 Tax=Micromonospora sp. NBC_01699 TaxID=2975984 RepID=UPI002E2CA9FE|nr:DUF3152 domain-containing protein [Micromonospora sp. NBC_01699]
MPARRTGPEQRPVSRRLLLPAVGAVVIGLVVALLGLAGEAGGKPEPSTTRTTNSPVPDEPGTAGQPPASAPAPPQSPPVPETAITAPVTYPEAGPRTWQTVGGRSPVLGRAGQLLRFRVAVENGITGITPDAFADAVVSTLGDPRSWTGTGQRRLQRVGPTEAAAFTVYLATPATRDRLCDDGYDRYTSCRNGNQVVVNVARWAHGVPDYGAPLATYQQYVINHEVGHRLGQGHQLCPAPGKPAPVMQQQTLSLHRCTPNPYPLLNGKFYATHSGHYNDPIPH